MGCGSGKQLVIEQNNQPGEVKSKKLKKISLSNLFNNFKQEELENCEGANVQNLKRNFTKLDTEKRAQQDIFAGDHINQIPLENKYFILDFDEEIIHLGLQVQTLEIAFLIDSTASMNIYSTGVIKTVQQIITDAINFIKKNNIDDTSLKIAYVFYRDHKQEDFFCEYETKIKDFDMYQPSYLFIQNLELSGGGDETEAVIDGLYDVANNISWGENSAKFVFHFADSPPHGKKYSKLKDFFPQGCPCEKNIVETFEKFTNKQIHYILIELSESLTNMINNFAKMIDLTVIKVPSNENAVTISFDQYK